MKMKKVLSLLLALFCASSLFCAPVLAAESESTENRYSVTSSYFFGDYQPSTGSVAYPFRNNGIENGYMVCSRAFSENDNRAAYAGSTYRFYVELPYVAYYDIHFSVRSRFYYYDSKGVKIYPSFRISVNESTIGDLYSDYGNDWVSLEFDILNRRISSPGRQQLQFVLSIQFENGVSPTFPLYVEHQVQPEFYLTDNDYNRDNVIARSAKDYFSAGKKAFFTCPECGSVMNQDYFKLLWVYISK